jgi:hypothetical protein
LKKFILTGLAVMLVLGLVSTSFAFNGAHQGNGGLIALGLANYQTTNLGNTWINPAAINAYKNKAFGFLGGDSSAVIAPIAGTQVTPDHNGAGNSAAGRDAMAGAHFDTPAGVLGIWINRGNPMIDASTTAIGSMNAAVGGVTMAGLGGVAGATGVQYNLAGTLTGPTTPHNNLDLFYGRDIGAALIGVRINYNATKSETTTEENVDAEGHSQTVNAPKANVDTVSDASENIKARDIGLHFGVAMKDMPVNASLLIGLPSFSDEGVIEDTRTSDIAGVAGAVDTTTTVDVEETMESDGAMNIGLYVNGALKMSDTTTLVPTLFFEKTKNNATLESSYTEVTTFADSLAGTPTSTQTFDSEGAREGSGMVFGVDGALNMKPNDKTLVVAALGLTYVKSETTMENTINDDKIVQGAAVAYNAVATAYGPQDDVASESSTISIPFAVGVQNKTFKKVTTRLGMKTNIYTRTKTTTTTKTMYGSLGTATAPVTNSESFEVEDVSTTSGTINNGAPVTVSMGFSVKLGEKMGLTAVLNEDILFGGGYLISGMPETMNTIVSVGYSW